jgi:hypothetical protein
MNEVLIMALTNRILAWQLAIEQVPEPLQAAVQEKVDEFSAN